MATYEEMIAKSRELAASGDMVSAKRVAEIAIKQRDKTPQEEAVEIFDQNASERASQSGFFANPETDQMTSRDLLKNRLPEFNRAGAVGFNGLDAASAFLGGDVMGVIGKITGGDEQARFNRESFSAIREKSREKHPGFGLLGNVIGGIGLSGPMSAELLAGKAGSAIAKTSAGIGAVEGGIAGFGLSEGDAKERLKGTSVGVGLGTVAGALSPLAVAVAGKGLNSSKNAIVGAVDGMTNRASQGRTNQKIAQLLKRSGKSADEIDGAIRQAAREGQHEFVMADALGNSGQRHLSGIARQPGDARQGIVDFLNQRQLDQGNRLSGFIDDGFDATETASQRQVSLKAARGAAADINYDAARGNSAPVDVRGALGVIDDRIGPMQGSGVLSDGIDGKLSKYRSRLANQTPDGDISSVELSDFDRVLGVKQDIQDDIGTAVRAGRNNEERELKKLFQELDGALEAASPLYRNANDEFATASRNINAVGVGQDFARPSNRATNNIDTFQGMTPEQQAQAKLGFGDKLLAKIENSAEGVNKARPFQTAKAQAEIGAMATNPDLLKRRLGREGTMFETRAMSTGGSLTADNLADQVDTNLDVGMLTNLLSGRFGAAATSVTGKASAIATGQNEATRQLIADALLSKTPKKALARAISQSQSEASTRRAVELLLRQTGTKSGQTAIQ